MALGVLALAVVVGGGYLVVRPASDSSVAVTSTDTGTPMAAKTMAAQSAVSTEAAPQAASDSFDDFSAAMKADAAAQQTAVSQGDQSTNQAVSNSNTVNSSGQPYDPSSI